MSADRLFGNLQQRLPDLVRRVSEDRNIPPSVEVDQERLQITLNSLSNPTTRVVIAVIVFVLIIAAKILIDNVFAFVMVLFSIYFFHRIRSALGTHLSLKERSNVTTFPLLLIVTIFSLVFMISFSQLYVYEENIMYRLAAVYPPSNTSQHSLFEILWKCFVVDGIVQFGTLAAKLFCCCVMDSGYLCQYMFGLISGRDRYRPIASTGNNEITGDIESGTFNSIQTGSTTPAFGFHRSRQSPVTIPVAIPTAAISSATNVTGSMTTSRLARRQLSSGNINEVITTSSDQNTDSTIESSIGSPRSLDGLNQHTAECIDSNHGEDDTASRSNTRESASDYLNKLRLCSVVDIIGLFYRSTLPAPMWLYYLSGGSVSGRFLPVLYLFCKFFDLSWKVPGAIEAVSNFLNKKFEFGHYSTQEELQAASAISPELTCECPICFDTPAKPVTLSPCSHIFCEDCISAWLERDSNSTCPVCRTEVSSSSANLRTVKALASRSLPIVF